MPQLGRGRPGVRLTRWPIFAHRSRKARAVGDNESQGRALAFLTMGNFINHEIALIRITIQPARVCITDWINALAVVLMVTSGWQIYDASPIFPALQFPPAITLGGWLLQKLHDKAAAKRFFKHLLASCPEVPRKIVTEQLRRYPAAKDEIPELVNVKHVFFRVSARLNNRAENSHQPTRERERRMRGFRDPTARRRSFRASIRQHFALKRHLLRASLYRKQLGECFAAWHRFTELSQNPSGF
jgi:hypothetical protein